VRNDLGRVCRFGSVEVPSFHVVEHYTTVHQLVSTVRGTLAHDKDGIDLVRACFPPGSMTGAPKIRSVELLRELEDGPRGPYAGALGYWSSDGRLDLAVVIRTLLVAGGEARVNVGGGLVWESHPDAEFEECAAKAAALLAALAAAGAAA